MKRTKKPVFFIVFALILFLACTSILGIYGENGDFKVTYIKGINDIRWGIDIKGGVEAVFAPANGIDASDSEMESVKAILDLRLVSQNVTDYETTLTIVSPCASRGNLTKRTTTPTKLLRSLQLQQSFPSEWAPISPGNSSSQEKT